MENRVLIFYRERKETFLKAEQNLSGKVRRISFYRLFVFLLIPFSYFWLSRFGSMFGIAVSLIFFAIFLFLVKKYIKTEKERKRFNILIKLAEDEIKALNHQFLHFEAGNEFKNPGHNYSYDLDVFGEGSVFQFLNRTSTISGRRKLARWLTNPPLEKKQIIERQEAIAELAGKNDWRLNFLATGKFFDESAAQHDEVIDWSKKDLHFANAKLTELAWKFFPALTMLMLVPAIWLSVTFPLIICVFIQWFILYLFRKRIKEYYRFFTQKSQLIEKYVSLLSIIEKEKFVAPWLINEQHKITSPESACRKIGKLGRLVREFEFRQNLVVAIFLNSLFLWDIRCIHLLHKWHSQNRGKLIEWLEVIEDIDALISLANFANNHPGYSYPKISDGEFVFNGKDLGHPLLHPEKRVCSDFYVSSWSKVIIVTGANMAGKSTFLRAVGVNLILARAGAPVCASDLVVTPIELYTNMRTTDSLFNDESYFFAELKRLSSILNQLREGKELFVIIDEMLKGTNSIDKLNGSKELIRKLVQLKSISVIATHDLKLSEMELEFPDNIYNKCFEIKIVDNEMVFDYKLSDGVTKTMNATFLMKKMGII